MSVRNNLRAGLRVGALAVLAFLYVGATASTAILGVMAPDPTGIVWLSIAAFLTLFLVTGSVVVDLFP